MTLDRAVFQSWLDRYIAAWRSNDPTAIWDLVAEDAVYHHRPTDEPLRGRGAIVADWRPEDPATWDARYEVLAIDGEVHVASGWSNYLEDGVQVAGYSNIFVCRFDAGGRCTEFTEWWTQDRRFEG